MKLNTMQKSIICAAAMSLALAGCKSGSGIEGAQSLDFGAAPKIPRDIKSDTNRVMSEKYWALWNDGVQKEIDARIEKFRKSDARLNIADIDASKPVEVRQTSHKFIFGAHIFNFNQLGKTEYNDIYKSLYGTLFNSATVAFYWKTFEFELGKPRFETEFWDTEDFWNNVPNPKLMPHWRRPSSDQVVDFCRQKKIRIHGHPLVWGDRRWHSVEPLIFQKYANTPEQKAIYKSLIRSTSERVMHDPKYKNMSIDEFERRFANIAEKMAELTDIRVREIAKRYGDKIASWDVVNESASDVEIGALPSKSRKITHSLYGIMEPDYDLNAFMLAQKYLPSSAMLNINDYNMKPVYAKQIQSLIKRGCKIDIVGSQMHLFNPQQTLDMAAGKENSNGKVLQTPKQVWEIMKRLSALGKPIHLSEITITAAGTSEKERMMQAIALRNLYRMWFSIENMMGITWWNVVDDCGAPGEPSMSGLFTRDMKPKPAFFAMNELINKEWKTNATLFADDRGNVSFRGFKGGYEISYTDKSGEKKTIQYKLD